MLYGLIGPNAGLYVLNKEDIAHVLFRSDGKLGQYVINIHKLAMGALCLLAATITPLAFSVAFAIIGALTIYNSITAYNAGVKGEVLASAHFAYKSFFG
jgi:hypothetical protein